MSGVFTVFILFCKFSLLCFGGGYMLIPLIISDCVEKYHFLTLEQFGNLLSVSQLTPGPIGINAATYVGYIHGGFFSSLAATLGLVFPTFVLSSLAILGIRRWKDTFFIRGIMRGTRLSSVALILYAGSPFPENFSISWSGLVIALISAFAIWKKLCGTTVIILSGAALGALLQLLV